MSRQQLNIFIAGLLATLFVTGSVVNGAFEIGGSTVSVKSLKPQAVTILKNSLNSERALTRTQAVEVAVTCNQTDLLPVIAKLTKDPTVPVRFAAVVGLGDMASQKHEDILKASLNDIDVNVRIAAAYALVKLDQPKYEGLLLAAAKNEDQTVRANAALLIGKLGKKEHIPLLHEVMKMEDSVDKVRMQTVESIARLGDEEMYRSKLWALLISKYADDRVMGIRGMGALNTAESKQAIRTMLQDDIIEVRLTAAEQLAQLDNKSGENEVFLYFQTDPSLNKANMASGMAVMAIGNLKSQRLNSYLPKALESQAPYIRLMAARSVLLQVK